MRVNYGELDLVKAFATIVAFVAVTTAATAQAPSPVKWSIQKAPASAQAGQTVTIQLAAQIEKGWHLYALDQPSDGPIPTEISVAPATQFAAGAQHTLYSGVPLADHGLFYPFQWSADEQRVHYMGAFPAPPPVWEQLAPTGARTLAIDPYESRPPTVTPPGTLLCGWQLHDRVVLRRWESPDGLHARLSRAFGPPEPVDEVFGTHTVTEMLGLRRRLLAAPGRVADAIVWSALHPRKELAVGFKARAAITGHRLLPGVAENIAGDILHRVQVETAPPAPPTAGTLYEPMQEGTGVRGDVRERMEQEDAAREAARSAR